MSRYLFAMGGTGGHLLPGIALAEWATAQNSGDEAIFLRGGSVDAALQRPTLEQLMGRPDRLEAYPTSVPAMSWSQARRNPWTWLTHNLRGVRAALKWLDELRPAVVIGCGGYASVPTVFAAVLRDIPIVLLEQNAVAGRANRLLSRWARKVCLTFEASRASFGEGVDCEVTGNPVRVAIANLATVRPATSSPTLLITGGSLGAQAINSAVFQWLTRSPQDFFGWNVIHQTGREDAKSQLIAAYQQAGIAAEVAVYFTEMAEKLTQAELVLARAGGGTIAETTCAGLASVLIPYPQSADDHQVRNAEVVAAAGAAVWIPQTNDVTAFAESIRGALLPLMQEESRRREMSRQAIAFSRPQASAAVWKVLHEVADGRPLPPRGAKVGAGSVMEQLRNWGPGQEATWSLSQSEAEAYCRRLTFGHYENFPVVTWLLPRELRQHFCNVYAFCRWADDLADECSEQQLSNRQLLDWWQQECDRCFQAIHDPQPQVRLHPVFRALLPTLRQFQLSSEPFYDLISAFIQDQSQHFYETTEELRNYCQRSAAPVGRIVLRLCGQDTPQNIAWSDSICIGLQLANFWQDVSRDHAIGRCYLPRAERLRYGYTDEDWQQRLATPGFLALMADLVALARREMEAGRPLIRAVRGRIRVDLELFLEGGLQILREIEKIRYLVWTQRPQVRKSAMIFPMARSVCGWLICQ